MYWKENIIPLLNNSNEYWSRIWLCFGQRCGLKLAICCVHLISWCWRCFRMAVEPLLRACLVDGGLWQQALGNCTRFHFCPSFPLQICQDVRASITRRSCRDLCWAFPATLDGGCGPNTTALLLSCICHVFCHSDEKSRQTGRLHLSLDATVPRLD